MEQDDDAPRGPRGDLLECGRYLTFRQARTWARRADTALGVWPCGAPIQWLDDTDRALLVQRMRHAEGRDCSPDGDVLLFHDVRGDALLVIERE